MITSKDETKVVDDAIKDIAFQHDAAKELGALVLREQGALLQGGTGTGKTYITCEMLRDILPQLKANANIGGGPIPVLWIAPAATILQTQRVLRSYGLAKDVLVMSYSALTSPKTGGCMYYDTKTVVELGTEHTKYTWSDVMLPRLVVFDECQALKNDGSSRTNVERQIPKKRVKRLFISATPYQRVCEARTVMTGCAIKSEYNVLPLCESTVPSVLRSLATYGNPTSYSPRAMERVKDVMKPYTVALKNVRFKYKARTECVMIDFRSDKERAAYNEAYEEYLKYLYELRGQRGHGIVAARLVAMMKFRQKAEEIRSPQIASRARNAVVEGSQVIVGSNFKSMLRGVWLALTKTYNVPEERIGFITGGQSAEERQRHVDAFQRGEKDYMLLTVAAGGVGISLHHEDMYTNAKPRHIILPPTWSAIDLIQCVGRSHRLTSCSNTLQEVIWYRNTIEERVAAVVQNKVACINKAVTAKEQWSSLFAPDVEDDLGNVNDDDDDDEDHTLDEGMFE